MMINIPRGKGPGHWMPVIVDEWEDSPRWSAVVWCPDCGKPLSCIRHNIAANGQINPSLGHPVEYPPCPWHVSPRLIGWEVLAPLHVRTESKNECERCHRLSRLLGGWGVGWGYKLVCNNCIGELDKSGVQS